MSSLICKLITKGRDFGRIEPRARTLWLVENIICIPWCVNDRKVQNRNMSDSSATAASDAAAACASPYDGAFCFLTLLSLPTCLIGHFLSLPTWNYLAVPTIPPPGHSAKGSSISAMDQYKKMWKESVSSTCINWLIMTLFFVSSSFSNNQIPPNSGETWRKSISLGRCANFARLFCDTNSLKRPCFCSLLRSHLTTSRLAASNMEMSLGSSMAR